MPRLLTTAWVVLLLAAPAIRAAAQSFPPPLTDAEIREVTSAIEAMKADARGPYLRIRWFCNDGSVEPPQGTPCRERGGGVQYAEFNERARRLAELNFHVGTILQAVTFEDLFDSAQAHYRLRELIVAKYLFDVDDGWALRQAQFYRGARQIEDEERTGHALLEGLLGRPEWTAAHYLLAVRLVATIPHVTLGGDQLTYRIRNLATEAAELDQSFLPVRVKIHSFPSREDLEAVERHLASVTAPAVRAKLTELRDELRRQYDPRRNLESLAQYRRRLRGTLGDELAALERSFAQGDQRGAFAQIAGLAPKIRQLVTTGRDGRVNLVLMDLGLALQEQAFLLAQDLVREPGPTSRSERLRRLSDYLAIAHGAGFLSARERDALDREIARLRTEVPPTALEYKTALGYLGRSLDWSAGTVRSYFGPVIQRYLPVAPKVVGFPDAVMRGSVLLPLSQALDVLDTDADRVLGASHEIFGQRVSQGVRGLNPGVVRRPLEILEPERAHAAVEPTKIYVVPATTPELKPVAGVLTLDAGNLLSHVQLLARNLGIPNASVSSSLLPVLRSARGTEVFYAVSPLGRVFLKRPGEMTPEDEGLLDGGRDVKIEKIRLDTSRLRLDRTAPLPLSELRAELSGVYVGPKAANLGQLAAYFPSRVSRGVALPFGMFVRHANRPFGSDRPMLEDLEAAYRHAAAMRAAGMSEEEIDRYMFRELARVRKAILDLPWLPDVRDAVVDAVRVTFGGDLSGGVFVRSDTNVEDLPQFSGAGLNLTVPHQRTLEDVLASIKRVWTSPFSERAYLWRKQILEEQGRIYPSVLLLESVPSEKSGVMITSGLQFGDSDDLTIATAEGVGGAVEGEEAEMIVVDSAGTVTLLSQAKAPVRRVLVDRGVATVVGRLPDVLLRQADIATLRAVAAEWQARFAPGDASQVWDIEFGFVGDTLWLFQIRPFVRFRSSALLTRLQVLDRDVLERADRRVALVERI